MKETLHFGQREWTLKKKGKFFSHSTSTFTEKETLCFTWITRLILTLRSICPSICLPASSHRAAGFGLTMYLKMTLNFWTCYHLLSAGITYMHFHVWLMRFWWHNPRLGVCQTSKLQAELHLQPPNISLNLDCSAVKHCNFVIHKTKYYNTFNTLLTFYNVSTIFFNVLIDPF